MIKTIKELAFDFRVKAGYASAFILLIISYVLTIYTNNQLIKQVGWVNNSNKVISNLETLLSGIKDAENGIRGYISSKDSVFLAPYQLSNKIIESSFSSLRIQTKYDNFQQTQLDTLSLKIRENNERLLNEINYFKSNGRIIDNKVLEYLYLGRSQMGQIRYIISEMQYHESTELASRDKALDSRNIALKFIIISSLIVALIFAAFGFYTYHREKKARIISDTKIKEYQEELKQQIIELDTANAALVQMKRSEKFAATGRVARTIAHEIRNPLTNIDLAVSQIKADLPEQDESSAMLFDMVLRNSKRINQLISDLLNATRFTDLSISSVSINALLDEALLLAKDRIDLTNIQIERKYSADICDVSVDAEKVKIAFLNLIVNAIEAMKPGEGILGLYTKSEAGKCVVEIVDNGEGMNEEQLNNLFEPYYSTKKSGNGLGLTNTANIILNHDGDINIKSKPGEGTTFQIKFNFAD
jgi:signal transduction histidine kinase